MSDKGFIMQPDGDIVFVTVSKYRMFYAHGEAGMDALHLYLHLIFTCRLQFTNTVKAHNIYLQKGLHWGKERTLKAKNLLFEFDLIKQIERKNSKGQFEGTYIIVKTTTSPFELKEYTLAEVSGGLETGGLETAVRQEETNALTNNINALTNKQMLRKKNMSFKEPSLEDIKALVKERNYTFSSDDFFDYYNELNWHDKNGKKVSNWKLKALTWQKNQNDTPPTNAFKEHGSIIEKKPFREIGDKI